MMMTLKWILADPEISLVIFNFIAMVLLFVSSFGSPFIPSVSIIRIEAVPLNASYNLGVLGVCGDFDQVGRLCSPQVVGYSLDAVFDQPQQFMGTTFIFNELRQFSTALLSKSSFSLQSVTRPLIIHIIAFTLSLLTLVLFVISQIKRHALSQWMFQSIILVKLCTLAASIADIVLFISLHDAIPSNVKLVAGPSIYLTIVALVSLFLGCVMFKLQTSKMKLGGKKLDDYEMSVFWGEAKQVTKNQQEDTDVDGEEKLRQLRELLYSMLGPTSPQQQHSISTATSPLSHSFHSGDGHEEDDELGTNPLIQPWPRKLGRPKLQAITVMAERRSSSPYVHARSQSLPLQGLPLPLPDSPFSMRIIPDMSIQGSPMFPPPSFRSAIPSSGIASNISSRRTSSLRSQNVQRMPSNSSSLSVPYHYQPKSKKPRRPTHIESASLGLGGNTMCSTSSSTLDIMIPQFPPVPRLDSSYYPYGTFRMEGRNKFDAHTSSSSSFGGGKTPSSALPSSDGDGPVRMEDLDDI